jgi:UDP-hydrolysing UDP-N-acetyl-D-glucosamine 2-epimerase
LLAEALGVINPDFLMLVGDRFETAAAALAASLETVPIVHLHGGEETEGAIDNLLRHAITKMSHLHLVSHSLHYSRIVAMGEHPGAVHIVGAPGLDNMFRDDLPSLSEVETRLGIPLSKPVIIVTLHPVTVDSKEGPEALKILLGVMEAVKATYIITLPNADKGNQLIREAFLSWADSHRNAIAVEALGERFYYSLMREADLMVGNSSSALVEAPVYQLPAINIGTRQKGRLCGQNVVHVDIEATAAFNAFSELLAPKWRDRLKGTTSLYGDGRSAERIVEILCSWEIPKDTRKSFFEG